MENDFVKVNKWLLPLSWLYGIAVSIRNALFDMGVLKSHRFRIPIIGVGNITSGGTGKTPHVEYIIRLLHKKYHVATLSRGYKRKSKGYVLADINTPMKDIGDEPWQLRQKFRDIYVAVDSDRVRGITNLCKSKRTKDVEVVLLDDSYQHRYVEPGMNILLVDYHRLISKDFLLPAGRLREPTEGKNRAHVVVVTKCPPDITQMDFRIVQKDLDLRPYQKLYFSTMRYDSLQGLFVNKERHLETLGPQESVFLITAIAVPEQIQQDLGRYTSQLTTLSFPDHHFFTSEDFRQINARFKALPKPRIAITTEKDTTRLLAHPKKLGKELCQSLYVLPVRVEFLKGEADNFDKRIIKYVHKHQRNSGVAGRKDKD